MSYADIFLSSFTSHRRESDPRLALTKGTLCQLSYGGDIKKARRQVSGLFLIVFQDKGQPETALTPRIPLLTVVPAVVRMAWSGFLIASPTYHITPRIGSQAENKRVCKVLIRRHRSGAIVSRYHAALRIIAESDESLLPDDGAGWSEESDVGPDDLEDEGFVEDESGREFWGSRGSGLLFVRNHPEHGRQMLIVKRSPEVEEPNTWGTTGGAVPQGEGNLFASAVRETREEIGGIPPYDPVRKYIWRAPGGTFAYTTFILECTDMDWLPSAFNWEATDARWVSPEDAASYDLHFGLQAILGDLGMSVFPDTGEGLRTHAGRYRRASESPEPPKKLYHGTMGHYAKTIAVNGIVRSGRTGVGHGRPDSVYLTHSMAAASIWADTAWVNELSRYDDAGEERPPAIVSVFEVDITQLDPKLLSPDIRLDYSRDWRYESDIPPAAVRLVYEEDHSELFDED